MKKVIYLSLLSLLLSNTAFAAKVCKVSMMGRVCYEEGQAPDTASHMKKDAVAEAKAKGAAKTTKLAKNVKK